MQQNPKINTIASSSSLCSTPALTGYIHVEKDPSQDKDKDKDKCLEPFLVVTVHVDKDKNGQAEYNYKILNTGDAPLKELAVLDNAHIKTTSQHTLAPGEGVEFKTLEPLHLSN